MKNSILVIGVMLLSTLVSAQVKLNLSYDAATKVYTVSALPEVTWNAPLNMINTAQIVLRVDAGVPFTPGITTLVDGLIWADNAYVELPDVAPGYTFVCISLVNGPTTKIGIANEKEVPLFAFTNVGGDCVGKIALLDNSDPMVQAVRANGYNITQNLPILGAKGNAFAGVLTSSVDCAVSSSTKEEPRLIDGVMVSPVPADKTVNVQWTQVSDQHALRQIVVCDAKGSEVLRERISNGKGPHALTIQVENWQAGLYRLRFVSDQGHQTKAWNLMVIH